MCATLTSNDLHTSCSAVSFHDVSTEFYRKLVCLYNYNFLSIFLLMCAASVSSFQAAQVSIKLFGTCMQRYEPVWKLYRGWDTTSCGHLPCLELPTVLMPYWIDQFWPLGIAQEGSTTVMKFLQVLLCMQNLCSNLFCIKSELATCQKRVWTIKNYAVPNMLYVAVLIGCSKNFAHVQHCYIQESGFSWLHVFTVKMICQYIHAKKIAIPRIFASVHVLAIAPKFFDCLSCLANDLWAACHVYPWLECNLPGRKETLRYFQSVLQVSQHSAVHTFVMGIFSDI